MVSSYQSQLADAPNASEEFARGNLEGDVHMPKAPVRDPVVMDWFDLTEPKLTPTHDTVGRALASFFSREGGWVYVSQDDVAKAARLSRPTANRKLLDLVKVGLFEKREVRTYQGNRADAYRAYGESVHWQPTDLGQYERTTVAEFEKDRQIHLLKEAMRELLELVPADRELPNSALLLLNDGYIETNSAIEGNSDYYQNGFQDNHQHTSPPLLSNLVNSGLEIEERERGELATQGQLVEITIQQRRTGLTDDDIREAWQQFNPGSEPPAFLEEATKFRAFRLVGWLRQQPDAPLEETPGANEVDNLFQGLRDQTLRRLADIGHRNAEGLVGRLGLMPVVNALDELRYEPEAKNPAGWVTMRAREIADTPYYDFPYPEGQRATDDLVCTCPDGQPDDGEWPEDMPATPDGAPSAQEVWRAVLGELEAKLPRPTFETWFKETVGVGYDDSHFLVQVPTPFAIAWLERRMYQSIQRTVETVTGHPLEVQFQVTPENRQPRECPVHGRGGGRHDD